ncbi:MAG: hypothetical protein PUG34_04270 [Eubacteriales bacterium]|nr:hypothetical protein [Eubacteriales bacterium]MDD7260913.1 hypothetical protein [Eubacteriales bacterium]
MEKNLTTGSIGQSVGAGSLLSVIICLIAFALTWPKAVNTQMEDRV